MRDPIRLWNAILRHRKLFAGVWCAVIAAAVVMTLFQPKTYTTTVRLMAGRPGAQSARPDADTALPVLNALVLQNGEQSIETMAELAQQHDIADSVARQLHLNVTPQALLAAVSAKPVVNTSLLTLSVTWDSPQRSADIANSFANAFVERERDLVRSQAVAAIDYLSSELPKAAAQMHDSAQRLADFQSTHGFIDAGARAQDISGRLASLDQRIDQLVVDRREAQALLQNAQAELARTPASMTTAQQLGANAEVNDLHEKLAAVKADLAQAQVQYTDSHPAVVALRQQQALLERRIAALPATSVNGSTVAPNPIYQSLVTQIEGYQGRLDGDDAQLTSLRAQRKDYEPQLHTLPELSMQFATLREDATRAANVYNLLAQKQSDALVAKSTAISDVFVVQNATADAATRHPSLVINAGVAIVVGLFLATMSVLIAELIERRTRVDDVAGTVGLPVIARIPDLTRTQRHALPLLQSMTVEAFMHLCVALRMKRDPILGTIALVSPARGDGKSTISYQLAKTMATLQTRVLLIDGDLRRPTLHLKANRKRGKGLCDVLMHGASLDESVQRLSPTLHLLSSGTPCASPIVALQQFPTLLRDARERYDMIVIDAPPIAAVSDGLLITTNVDGSLLVVDERNMDEAAVQSVVNEMTQLGIRNLLGVVANRHDARGDDYFDYFAPQQALPGEVGAPS